MEVEDDNKWGDGSETHDVMCATVLSEVYGIETREILQRVSAAELTEIGDRMVALLHTGAELPRDAIKEIKFPQGEMINADGSESSTERLAWKEAVLASIEGMYPPTGICSGGAGSRRTSNASWRS